MSKKRIPPTPCLSKANNRERYRKSVTAAFSVTLCVIENGMCLKYASMLSKGSNLPERNSSCETLFDGIMGRNNVIDIKPQFGLLSS